MQTYVSWAPEIMILTFTCVASSILVLNCVVTRDSLGKNDQVL